MDGPGILRHGTQANWTDRGQRDDSRPLPVVEQIQTMEQLDHVLGVILRIESPGGSVAASQEIHEALNQLRRNKPVYASLGSVAASGGYYIACVEIRPFGGSLSGRKITSGGLKEVLPMVLCIIRLM